MQELFNIVIAIAGAIGGGSFKVMWETIKDLQTADKELMDKVSKSEVLVAGAYVKRDEFERTIMRLFEKLDHIDAKLDNKADK